MAKHHKIHKLQCETTSSDSLLPIYNFSPSIFLQSASLFLRCYSIGGFGSTMEGGRSNSPVPSLSLLSHFLASLLSLSFIRFCTKPRATLTPVLLQAWITVKGDQSPLFTKSQNERERERETATKTTSSSSLTITP